jgi:hypothetical protein
MGREAPFISKALKLVSLAIMVAIVAIAATAAYSGYEEYGALVSVGSASSSQLSAVLNGSTLMISGLNVPNRMIYPLTLELLGNVSIDDARVGNFDTGAYVIQPGHSQGINVSIPLNYAALLNDTKALKQAISNSSILTINTTVAANMVPLLGINITKSANMTIGPILGDLSAKLNTSDAKLSSDRESIIVPVTLSWNNLSPLPTGSLWLNASLTALPGRQSGTYGSASGVLNFVRGQNTQTFDLKLPITDFTGKGVPSGTYSILLSLSQGESSTPFLQTTESVTV